MSNQRGFPITARRNQEDLLGGRQITDKAIELDDTVRKGCCWNDFSVDKGVLQVSSLRLVSRFKSHGLPKGLKAES